MSNIPNRLKQQIKLNTIRDINKNKDDKSNEQITIKIFCGEYLRNLGIEIKYILENTFKDFIIEIYEINKLLLIKKQHINEYFFIIGFSSQNLIIEPEFKYFLYQLEQINTKEKFKNIITKQNSNLILNSLVTFDYSELNIENYTIELKNKVELLYPPIREIEDANNENKIYDILFFGKKTERRVKIMNELNRFYNVKFVDNVFGNELKKLILQSKICLNLHYYNKSCLEKVRIHELLMYDSIILSEYPDIKDMHNIKPYLKLLDFIENINEDLSNISILISKIDDILGNYDHYIDLQIKSYKSKSINKFSKIIYEQYLLLDNYININKYKFLFHKYICGSINRKENINYDIIQDNKERDFIENLLYAHLHCYNIEEFNNIYGNYVSCINYYFKIIVTYSIGNVSEQLLNSKFVILKIKNKGLDIGAKFCCVKYLNDSNIDYDYIFFLHSKTNEKKRFSYFNPFYQYLYSYKIKNKQLNEIYKYDALFPNIKWTIIDNILKNEEGTIWPERNNNYRKEFLDYLNCKTINNDFFEGNVYILSKEVTNIFFTDKHIYNMLNNGRMNDFDYNWTLNNSIINNKKNQGVLQAYNFYKTENYQNKVKNIIKIDGCIEHCFERSILSFCNNYKVIKYNNTCCILFYVTNVSVFNKLLKDYEKLFNDSKYSKLTELIIITNNILIKEEINELKLKKKYTMIYSPKLNNTCISFYEGLQYLKDEKKYYNIYLTIATTHFNTMNIYTNKLKLLYNNLDNMFFNSISGELFI
jgi:hypothetical protein